ncbi:MAG: protein kinase [Planctomycetes bacterium]|nr:protein kinase [Planctomycetota bacterium]
MSDAPLPRLRGYEVLKDLGPSRLGRAYRAKHLVLGRVVLVKILDPDLISDPEERQRFLRGAAATVKLRHENVVSLYAFETDPETGREFVALEFVEGSSLEDVLAQGPLEETRALAIAIGLARALACLEEHGYVHRYLTPHTVLLTERGSPKLSDLGLVKPAYDRHLTGPNKILGSENYMAPEQALGLPLDSRADLFSLGVLLFEMLTGRLPPRPPEVPDPRLIASITDVSAKLVLRLCAQAPAGRFPSAREALEALEGVAASVTALNPAQTADLARFLLESRPAWRSPRLRVHVQLPDKKPRERLLEGETITVGRAPGCELRLDTQFVSRRHAQFQWQGEVLWLLPLSKTNATAVNGREITSPVPVHPGDEIGLSERAIVRIDWTPSEKSAKAKRPDSHHDISALLGLEAKQVAKDGATQSVVMPPAGEHSHPKPARPRLVRLDTRESLPLSPLVQAGSSTSCPLRLPPEAPRKALVVFATPEGVWLLNVCPDAGAVHVNAEPISDKAKLQAGDTIALYGVELKLRTD